MVKIKEVKKAHPTLLSAVWLGGEPLLRPDLVAEGKKLFSFNEIITNGTLPLPNWPDVRFGCSVDGTNNLLRVFNSSSCRAITEKCRRVLAS